jgi:hypothetical protein
MDGEGDDLMDGEGGGVMASLKERVGPFPLYVWLLAMTGIGVVLLMLKKKKSGTPTTGTPGTPCTQSGGSAGTWDSTGTVCQATTVSTVNAPATTSTGGSGMRNWRSQSGGPTVSSTPPTTTSTAGTVPPPATTTTTAPPPTPAGTTVTVPNMAGMAAGAAHNQIVALGLVPKAPAGQTANMKVSYTNPGFGAKVAPGSSVLIETSGYVS